MMVMMMMMVKTGYQVSYHITTSSWPHWTNLNTRGVGRLKKILVGGVVRERENVLKVALQGAGVAVGSDKQQGINYIRHSLASTESHHGAADLRCRITC